MCEIIAAEVRGIATVVALAIVLTVVVAVHASMETVKDPDVTIVPSAVVTLTVRVSEKTIEVSRMSRLVEKTPRFVEAADNAYVRGQGVAREAKVSLVERSMAVAGPVPALCTWFAIVVHVGG